MAESQVPYNYKDTGADLINTLSETRFRPYLVSAGRDQDYAFALYLYNARMAKAFLYPLHILEITLRNRINEMDHLGNQAAPETVHKIVEFTWRDSELHRHRRSSASHKERTQEPSPMSGPRLQECQVPQYLAVRRSR